MLQPVYEEDNSALNIGEMLMQGGLNQIESALATKVKSIALKTVDKLKMQRQSSIENQKKLMNFNE